MSERTATRDAASALMADEILRTRSFLMLSGALGVCGAASSFLVDGDPLIRLVFVVWVIGMLTSYVGLYVSIRRPEQYTPEKALVVVAFANTAGTFAALYFGVFSPAPMVLMVPIAFFGMSRGERAAVVAHGIAAGSMALVMGLVVIGAVDDPGVVTAEGLGPWQQALYAALVQAVYAAAFLLARATRRATALVLAHLAQAQEDVLQKDAQLAAAKEQLARADTRVLDGH